LKIVGKLLIELNKFNKLSPTVSICDVQGKGVLYKKMNYTLIIYNRMYNTIEIGNIDHIFLDWKKIHLNKERHIIKRLIANTGL